MIRDHQGDLETPGKYMVFPYRRSLAAIVKSFLRMSFSHSDRWQELCRKIAEEKDPNCVSQLVKELLRELDTNERSLTGQEGHEAH